MKGLIESLAVCTAKTIVTAIDRLTDSGFYTVEVNGSITTDEILALTYLE